MNRIPALAAGVTLATTVLLGASPARADWPSSPTIGVPVCVAAGPQGPAAMLPDGRGGAYLAWLDYRFTGSDLRFYAQHLDALGDPSYATDGIELPPARVPDERPALVSDDSGGAFAVWRDFRADTAGNLYAQRLAPGDPATWGANGLPVSTGPLHERRLAASPDGAGGFFVVWTDDRDGPDWQVRAQRVAPDGTLLWDEAGIVVAPNPSMQSDPRVAPDGEGGAVVAWTDTRGLMPNVFAQRLSGAGLPQWSAAGVLLSTSTHGVWLAGLAADGRGGAFAAFFDNRSQNSWQQAYAQHVDRDGALAWPADGLSLSGPAWPVQQVEVCGDGGGGAFVAWRDYQNGGVNNVYVAHADSAASAAASTTAGSGYDGNGYFGFSLAPDGAGGALVAWNGFDVDAFSVWAQRFDAALSPAWTAGGAKAAHSGGTNYGPRVVDDHRGGAILSWRDWSMGDGDLYAARLDATGAPGTAGVPPAVAPPTLALSAGPSPARAGGAVTLRLAMPAAGEARVTLSDVAGRRIAVVRGAAGAPGGLALRWDGRDEAGARVRPGLYFARAEAAGRTALARIVVTD